MAPDPKEMWIQTYTGMRFRGFDPQPQDIKIEDIAHGLSMTNRYVGQTVFPYSVAQHCILMSEVVRPENALTALLHDASEAYICDIPGPFKPHLPDYLAMEKKIQDVVAEKFRVDFDNADVHEHDRRMIATEARVLFYPVPTWAERFGEPHDISITEWRWWKAELKFLERYKELVGA